MPTTGSLFNLNKSWWSEDRHDAFKSTEAAVGYFSYLLKRFDGDIYLAIAAYNQYSQLKYAKDTIQIQHEAISKQQELIDHQVRYISLIEPQVVNRQSNPIYRGPL